MKLIKVLAILLSFIAVVYGSQGLTPPPKPKPPPTTTTTTTTTTTPRPPPPPTTTKPPVCYPGSHDPRCPQTTPKPPPPPPPPPPRTTTTTTTTPKPTTRGGYSYPKPTTTPKPQRQEQKLAEEIRPSDGWTEGGGDPFDFKYSVKDDPTVNDFSHNAESSNDVVKGEYRTLLPDGRVQLVKYTADWKNGYNAEITYT